MAREKTFTLRISAEEKRILEAVAKAMQRSMADAIRTLIREKHKEAEGDR